MNNRILKALPQKEYRLIAPQLKLVDLVQGTVLYEAGQSINDIYFPDEATISYLLGTADGDYVVFRTMSCDVRVHGQSDLRPRRGQCQSIQPHDIVWLGLQTVQKMEEPIVGTISVRPAIGRCCFGKRFLLHGECCLHVHLGRFYRFVTEPQSDDRAVDAFLKKVHSDGVSKNVNGNALLF